MNKKTRVLLVVFFFVCCDLFCSMEMSVREVLDRYCRVPLLSFIECDQRFRPSVSSFHNRAASTSLYFLATWMSLLVDRLHDDVSEDEFVCNFILQTIGWWVALGENLSHDRYRNFYMNPRNKVFAIAIICATSNATVFLGCIKRIRSQGFLVALKNITPFNDIGLSILRILPQCGYVLALPTR